MRRVFSSAVSRFATDEQIATSLIERRQALMRSGWILSISWAPSLGRIAAKGKYFPLRCVPACLKHKFESQF